MDTINYQGKELEVKFIRDAEAGNYGTDGDVRYQQDAIINGEEVRIYWNTTPEHDENNARYKELISIQRESGLDEEESDELYHLECFFDDNSKACDWDNADEIVLRDGGDFEF